MGREGGEDLEVVVDLELAAIFEAEEGEAGVVHDAKLLQLILLEDHADLAVVVGRQDLSVV